MNKKTIITALLAAVLALTSCYQSAQKAEVGQQADSTEAVTNADTLRLVVKDKETDGTLCRDCHHHQSHEAGRELRRGIHHRVRDGWSVAVR